MHGSFPHQAATDNPHHWWLRAVQVFRNGFVYNARPAPDKIGRPFPRSWGLRRGASRTPDPGWRVLSEALPNGKDAGMENRADRVSDADAARRTPDDCSNPKCRDITISMPGRL